MEKVYKDNMNWDMGSLLNETTPIKTEEITIKRNVSSWDDNFNARHDISPSKLKEILTQLIDQQQEIMKSIESLVKTVREHDIHIMNMADKGMLKQMLLKEKYPVTDKKE